MKLKDGKIVCDFCLVHEDTDPVMVVYGGPRWAAICSDCVSHCVRAIAKPCAKAGSSAPNLEPSGNQSADALGLNEEMQAAELIIALQSRGWTQVQIAERTGIPQPTISKLVRGAAKDLMSRSYQKLVALHAEVMSRHDAAAQTVA